MVIVVPEGDDEDGTRKKQYYDGTWGHLKEIISKQILNSHTQVSVILKFI